MVDALPSAAVILVRDARFGLEVLMLRRGAAAEAFGGAWVFPGGLVEPADFDSAADGVSPDVALAQLTRRGGVPPDSPAQALALLRAAARELCEEAGISIEPSALTYYSHWITPSGLPRRFDTRFFVAAMPEGQSAVHCGVETDEARWVTPTAALAAHAAGDFSLVMPTRLHLLRLSRAASIDEWLAHARAKLVHTVGPDRSVEAVVEGDW